MLELEDWKKRTARRKWPKRILYSLLVLLLALSMTPPGMELWNRLCSASGLNYRDGQGQLLEIHVIDVGKADAILIRSQGHAALLDAGTVLDGMNVVNYLTRFGVEDLDYAIVSHPDEDHVGGMSEVLWNKPVKVLVQNNDPGKAESPHYSDLQTAARRLSVECRRAEAGDSFWLGAACFTVLGPISYGDSANDNSLVIRLDCGDFSALFCGDAEKAAEKELAASGADLRADLLKVGHHGSETSSTQEFLDKVRPKYAVISVGRDRNKLPRESVLRRLEEMGAQVFRTDVSGDVVFQYDGDGLTTWAGRKADRLW